MCKAILKKRCKGVSNIFQSDILTCVENSWCYFKFTPLSFVSILTTITGSFCLVTDQIEAVLWTAVLTLLSVEWSRAFGASPCYRVTGLTPLSTSNTGWSKMIWSTCCKINEELFDGNKHIVSLGSEPSLIRSMWNDRCLPLFKDYMCQKHFATVHRQQWSLNGNELVLIWT